MEDGALIPVTMISDLLIAVAYFAIPAEMFFFFQKMSIANQGFPEAFVKVLYLFVTFIICCALTHCIMAIYPYHPTPILNCIMKWITALVSLYTSFQLFVVIPKVLYYPIYTTNVERENTERRIHEAFLEENVNIFRQIRKYTAGLETSIGTAHSLEKLGLQLSAILYQQLNLENALYLVDDADVLKRVCQTPSTTVCPSELPFLSDTSEVQANRFVGKWWVIPLEGERKGCVALKMASLSTSTTTRKTLVIGTTEGPELVIDMPETAVTVPNNIMEKDYLHDVIFDVIDHFEAAVAQYLANKRNFELIQQLTKQNDALVKSRQENVVVAKQSRDWLSVMSHEMRTPLFAIESLAELASEKVAKVDKDVFSSLALIQQSANHLSDIVNNILDFSKFENGQYILDRVEFNIMDIVVEAVTLNVRNDRRAYPLSCIFFHGFIPDVVCGDVLRVKQVLLNLLNNAVKFTPDEGLITVTTRCETSEETTDLTLYVEVADTGVGIKPEDEHKIFKEFSQSDATITRKFGGSGLGLSICKKLCQLMGGDVTFSSNPTGGTTFKFSSVLSPSSRPSALDTQRSVPPAIAHWRVHVVDDIQKSLDCTVFHLTHIGFTNISCGLTMTYPTNCDMLIINMRTKSVVENVEKLTAFLAQYGENIILHTSPYIKSALNVNSTYEINSPLSAPELLTMFMGAAGDKGLVPKETHLSGKYKRLDGLRILVAEDNVVNRTVLKKILQTFHMTADFAENGLEAVQMFKQGNYNVILMDIMMPVMDGFTATEQIRRICPSVKLPWIVALTANAFWEDRVKAAEHGMNDFVTKPAKIADIYNALCKASANVP